MELSVSHCTVLSLAQNIKEFLDHVLYLIYFEQTMVIFQKKREKSIQLQIMFYLERTMAVNGNSISSGKTV